MKIEWSGVYPAVTTKFTHDDLLDLKMFGLNLDAQLAAGVQGLILGGTLGEASTLTESEKDRLLEYALEKSAGRVPVILNIAEGSTRNAVAAAQRAEALGAHGLMVLPPMRYKTDHRETVAWFRTIADSTALPIMIYNNCGLQDGSHPGHVRGIAPSSAHPGGERIHPRRIQCDPIAQRIRRSAEDPL